MKFIAANILSIFLLLMGISQAYANESFPSSEEVVTELISSMENNDAKKIRSLFSVNATQEYEKWWKRKNQGDDFRAWLESDIISIHGHVKNAVIQADGNQVVVTGIYENNDNYKSPADFLLIVEGGKIISWTMRY